MAKCQIIAVLDNVRSRENVGSIFRTADAAGISKLYLCGITPCPPHPKIAKTALGAESYVSWEYHKNCWRLIEKLKAQKILIIALEQSPKARDIFKFKPRYPLALVVGNEVKGLPEAVLRRANAVVQIPMVGRKESLNVAVAFGIAAYAFCRQISR